MLISCRKPVPAMSKYPLAIGDVLAMEQCTGNEATEYWLICFDDPRFPFAQSDTMIFNGSKINALKVVIPEYAKEARVIGKKILISVERIIPYQPASCTVINPQIFPVASVIISPEGISIFGR